MATEVENRLITLNSANGIQRNTTKLSDMLFNFQNVLTDEDDIISSNICVMNAQIPVSFYIINETNNMFQINISSTPSTAIFVTVPYGNYTANSLVTKLNSLVSTTTLTFSFNQLTGKLVLTNSAGGNILILDNSNGMSKVLGYISGAVNASPMTFPYPLNLLGVKKLSIKSQLLGITSFQSGANQSTTLTTIPNNNAAYTMINYENQSNLNKSLVKVRKIDAIDIQIEDESGNKINFNNIDWTITLVLENIRKMKRAEVPHFLRIMEQQNEKITSENDIPDGLYGN